MITTVTLTLAKQSETPAVGLGYFIACVHLARAEI